MKFVKIVKLIQPILGLDLRSLKSEHIFCMMGEISLGCNWPDRLSLFFGSVREHDNNLVLQIEMRMSREENQAGKLTEELKAKVHSEWGRYIFSWRLGIVESVFGNVRWALGLDWFSLRGKQKVNGQWKLMATLHNLLKLQKYGTIG